MKKKALFLVNADERVCMCCYAPVGRHYEYR